MKKIYLQPVTEIHHIDVTHMMALSIQDTTGQSASTNPGDTDDGETMEAKEFIFEEDVWEDEGFNYEY